MKCDWMPPRPVAESASSKTTVREARYRFVTRAQLRRRVGRRRRDVERRFATPDTHPDGPRPGRAPIAAVAATRRRTTVDRDALPGRRRAVGADDRHRRRARHTREPDGQPRDPARVDDRGPRRERGRRRRRDARLCPTCLGGARPELDQDGDRHDDAAEQQNLDRGRAPEPRERTQEPRAVQPAEPEQRQQEHRLDDQDLAVRRRPHLGDGVKLGHCPGKPGCREHANRCECRRRETPYDELPLGVVRTDARKHRDQRDQPAEPDRGPHDMCEVRGDGKQAWLVAVESMSPESRRRQQGERAQRRSVEQTGIDGRERRGRASDDRDDDRDLSTWSYRVPAVAARRSALPPRNATSSEKKISCASGTVSLPPSVRRA